MRWVSISEAEDVLHTSEIKVTYFKNKEIPRIEPKLGWPINRRIQKNFSLQINAISGFTISADRWFPSGKSYLLWIEDFEFIDFNFQNSILCLRRGYGEFRTISEAPGLLINSEDRCRADVKSYNEQLIAKSENYIDYLACLIMIICASGSYAYIISEDKNQILGFVEDQIFFMSNDDTYLDSAVDIIKYLKI